MDPVAVLKTLWRYKIFVLPVILLTAVAAVYMFAYAPRTYEAKMTYAIVSPKTPTAEDIERDPALGLLNTDNPYLRSADTSLVAQVVVTRLNDVATGDYLADRGLSTNYKVERPSDAFLIDISGISDDKAQAIATSKALGERLTEDLRTIQSVNGASDRYLFTSLAVAAPDKATEQFSSRLRSVIVVVVAGLVLTLGAVSLARSIETSRNRAKAADVPRNKKNVRRRPDHNPVPENRTSDEDTLAHLETLVANEPPIRKEPHGDGVAHTTVQATNRH